MFSRMIKRFSSVVAMAACVIAMSVCSGFASGGEDNAKVLHFSDLKKNRQQIIHLLNNAKSNDYLTVTAYNDHDVTLDISYLTIEGGKAEFIDLKNLPEETSKIDIEFSGDIVFPSMIDGVINYLSPVEYQKTASFSKLSAIDNSSITTNTNWNVPYLCQLDYGNNMRESACGPTSLAMLLRYFFPNSGVDMPEIYHSGVIAYSYNSGPASIYRNISCAGKDSCFGSINQANRSYYTGISANYPVGMSENYGEAYLNNIWNIRTHVLTAIDQVYDAIQSGPLLGHVYGLGNSNYGHYLVIRGIDMKGTSNRSDDEVIVNDPYKWNKNFNGNAYRVSYNDFFVRVSGGVAWFRDAVQLIPNESVSQRTYTVVVDTGNNNFEGNSNVNIFALDSKDEKDSKGNFVWKFYYGQGGDWYFPDGKSGLKATWKPRIASNGNYQVSVKYKADKESGTVTYSIYNSSGKLLQSTDVNQYNLQASWKDNVIADNIYLENGYYVQAWNIPSGTNIDAVKFKYLGGVVQNPTAPSSMSATTLSSSSIKLTWTDSSNNETGFYFYRWNGSSWSKIATLGANTTSYTDTGLSSSATYYYTVASYNSAGLSQLSKSPGYISGSTQAEVRTGGIYGKLHINSASGTVLSGATVTCGGKSTTTDSSGKYSLSGVPVGSQTLSFSKSGYQSYQKNVTISGGTSLNAGDSYLTANTAKPAAPSSMSATALSSSSIKLTWTDSSNNETGFYLYRTTGGAWELLARLGANTTSHTDTGLRAKTNYYYSVLSYNSAGSSQLSQSPGYISVSTLAAPVTTGSVYGKLHINSASGSALSGATVTCGGKSTTTDSSGKYSLSGVPVGSQTLSFSKSGYQSYQKAVTVSG